LKFTSPINHLTNEQITHLTNEQITHLTNELFNQLTNLPINQSTNYDLLCKTNPILSAVGGLQMNVKSFHTVDYENKSNWTLGENKPNSNPIRTQSKPIKPKTKPKRTQNKPNQSQFLTGCGDGKKK